MTPEDPAVALVEEILTAAATAAGEVPICDGRAVADRAVWLCACVTQDDAPIWLIHDTADGSLDWRRVPDGADATELVDARLVIGDHVHPEGVLHWLRGEDADFVSSHGGADRAVYDDLGRRIRDLQSG